VIGTSVIGEGRDIPAADGMVYAAGGRSRIRVVQDYFRVLTVSEGKEAGIVVDFADDHHDQLTRHAAERLSLYRQEKCFESEVINGGDMLGWLEKAAQ